MLAIFMLYFIAVVTAQDPAPNVIDAIAGLDSQITTGRSVVSVLCQASQMGVRLKFTEPFFGKVFTEGDKISKECQFQGDGKTEYLLNIPLQKCGTLQKELRLYENTIQVNYANSKLQLQNTERKTVLCRYPPPVVPPVVDPLPPPVVVPPPVGPIADAGPSTLAILLPIAAILFLGCLLCGGCCAYWCLKKRKKNMETNRELLTEGSVISKASNFPPPIFAIPRANPSPVKAPSTIASSFSSVSDLPLQTQTEIMTEDFNEGQVMEKLEPPVIIPRVRHEADQEIISLSTEDEVEHRIVATKIPPPKPPRTEMDECDHESVSIVDSIENEVVLRAVRKAPTPPPITHTETTEYFDESGTQYVRADKHGQSVFQGVNLSDGNYDSNYYDAREQNAGSAGRNNFQRSSDLRNNSTVYEENHFTSQVGQRVGGTQGMTTLNEYDAEPRKSYTRARTEKTFTLEQPDVAVARQPIAWDVAAKIIEEPHIVSSSHYQNTQHITSKSSTGSSASWNSAAGKNGHPPTRTSAIQKASEALRPEEMRVLQRLMSSDNRFKQMILRSTSSEDLYEVRHHDEYRDLFSNRAWNSVIRIFQRVLDFPIAQAKFVDQSALSSMGAENYAAGARSSSFSTVDANMYSYEGKNEIQNASVSNRSIGSERFVELPVAVKKKTTTTTVDEIIPYEELRDLANNSAYYQDRNSYSTQNYEGSIAEGSYANSFSEAQHGRYSYSQEGGKNQAVFSKTSSPVVRNENNSSGIASTGFSSRQQFSSNAGRYESSDSRVKNSKAFYTEYN